MLRVNSISVNQYLKSFIVCSEDGLQIYQFDPLALLYQMKDCSILLCEQFKNTNILAIVGYGTHPVFGARKVVIYDMKFNQEIQTFKTQSKVQELKFSQNDLHVLDSNQFTTIPIKQIKQAQYINLENKKLLSLSQNPENPYAVITQNGFIFIINFVKNEVLNKFLIHDHEIALININKQGDHVVTCSEQVLFKQIIIILIHLQIYIIRLHVQGLLIQQMDKFQSNIKEVQQRQSCIVLILIKMIFIQFAIQVQMIIKGRKTTHIFEFQDQNSYYSLQETAYNTFNYFKNTLKTNQDQNNYKKSIIKINHENQIYEQICFLYDQKLHCIGFDSSYTFFKIDFQNRTYQQQPIFNLIYE